MLGQGPHWFRAGGPLRCLAGGSVNRSPLETWAVLRRDQALPSAAGDGAVLAAGAVLVAVRAALAFVGGGLAGEPLPARAAHHPGLTAAGGAQLARPAIAVGGAGGGVAGADRIAAFADRSGAAVLIRETT